jgi:molybdenum cofactor biosynthesis enzyme
MIEMEDKKYKEDTTNLAHISSTCSTNNVEYQPIRNEKDMTGACVAAATVAGGAAIAAAKRCQTKFVLNTQLPALNEEEKIVIEKLKDLPEDVRNLVATKCKETLG